MSLIEIQKIIKPINSSDGAGVKLKRSIGVEPNYFDPFLMLDEFGSENSEDYIAGFPPHPHRGIETVTYMLAGDFEHKDSTGGEGKMSAGDVQWMKTGSGIIHSEMPAMKEGKLHGFQLWINMPAKLKMSKPEYIYIDAKKMKIHKDKDKQIKVIAGNFEKAEGPVKVHNVEPIYFDVELNKGKKFDFKIPSTHNSFIYLINGEIEIGEKPILINVKSAVFTSNLNSAQISKHMISNNEMINLELQNFKENVENKLTKLKLNNFEKEIINEFINSPGRSDAGRLGFVVPEYIMQQSVKNYGLNKGDIILAINNIPIEKINDIYELYTDNNIKTYYIEIKRSNSLIMVEWYK